MNQIPEILYGGQEKSTWVIIGASRGIGLEFVRQLLQRGDRIFATVRDVNAFHASSLWAQAGSDHGRCQMLVCDVLSEESINVKHTFSLISRPINYSASDSILHKDLSSLLTSGCSRR